MLQVETKYNNSSIVTITNTVSLAEFPRYISTLCRKLPDGFYHTTNMKNFVNKLRKTVRIVEHLRSFPVQFHFTATYARGIFKCQYVASSADVKTRILDTPGPNNIIIGPI